VADSDARAKAKDWFGSFGSFVGETISLDGKWPVVALAFSAVGVGVGYVLYTQTIQDHGKSTAVAVVLAYVLLLAVATGTRMKYERRPRFSLKADSFPLMTPETHSGDEYQGKSQVIIGVTNYARRATFSAQCTLVSPDVVLHPSGLPCLPAGAKHDVRWRDVATKTNEIGYREEAVLLVLDSFVTPGGTFWFRIPDGAEYKSKGTVLRATSNELVFDVFVTNQEAEQHTVQRYRVNFQDNWLISGVDPLPSTPDTAAAPQPATP
jgi:hypothetical protein